MTIATDYRTMAKNQRLKAALAILPNVRRQFIAAAERWDWLAAEADAMQAGLDAMFEGVKRNSH